MALLIAEFALLDAPVAALAAAVAVGEATRIDGAELARLASDIPDLRSRLGIRCARTCRTHDERCWNLDCR